MDTDDVQNIQHNVKHIIKTYEEICLQAHDICQVQKTHGIMFVDRQKRRDIIDKIDNFQQNMSVFLEKRTHESSMIALVQMVYGSVERWKHNVTQPDSNNWILP